MNERLGIVVTYIPGAVADHQKATVADIARKVATLMDWDFGGEFDISTRYGQQLYFVPNHTLLTHEARALRIRHHDDLFGGVVPFPFVATKAIVHPLVAPDRELPARLVARLPRSACATRCYQVLLPSRCRTRGGRRPSYWRSEPYSAQAWPRHRRARSADGRRARPILNPACKACPRPTSNATVVGIELDLAEATTYSIGQVRIGGLEASYCGTQSTTTDNTGATAFRRLGHRRGARRLRRFGRPAARAGCPHRNRASPCVRRSDNRVRGPVRLAPQLRRRARARHRRPAGAPVYSSNPGAWAAPAGPKSRPSRRCAHALPCVQFAPARSNTTAARAHQPTPSSTSAVSTAASAHSPSTRP